MSDKYQILHLVGFYPECGGPVRSVGNLIKALSKKEVNCKILSPLPSNYDATKLTNIQNEFNVTYYKTTGLSRFFPSHSFDFSKTVSQFLKNINIIHLHGVFDYYSYWICKNVNDRPIFLSPHGSIVKWGFERNVLSYLKKHLFINSFGRMILDRADIIQLTTKYEQEEFNRIIGNRYNNKIRVIPNGVIVNDNTHISKELFFNTFKSTVGRRIILFLGRITKKKGLDILIPAFAELCKKNKELILVIAGPDERGYREVVENLIKKHRIEDNVLFTGHIDGEIKLSAYKASELFVLPSYTENFGMAVVEAMACELPVIVSKEVGIQREIERYNAGIVVDTNIQSLYQGIKILLDNPHLKKEVAINGRKLVKEYYDIDKVADRMLEVYGKVK